MPKKKVKLEEDSLLEVLGFLFNMVLDLVEYKIQ